MLRRNRLQRKFIAYLGAVAIFIFSLLTRAQSSPEQEQNKNWQDTLRRMAQAYEKDAPSLITGTKAAPKNQAQIHTPAVSLDTIAETNQSISEPEPEPEPDPEPEADPESEAEVEANTQRASPPLPEDGSPFQQNDPAEQLTNEPPAPLIPPPIPDDEELVRRFAEGEELVLSVVAAGFAKGEIFAITTAKGFRMGLLELSEVLDFAITLSDDSQSASGWFISPTNDFTLDVGDRGILTADVVGERFTLAPDDYEADFDLMLEADTLAQWFGLTFSLDEAKLQLSVSSSRPFPFEATERRRQQQLRGNFQTSVSVLPPIDNGYRLFSPPLLDAQLFTRKTDSNSSYGHSIASRQDLAFLSTNLFLSGNKDETLQEARLTFIRESSEGDLLGPLGLTEVRLGDVLPINAGTGRTSGFGRGISFNNIKAQLADNRLLNFTGIIQLGWDVELYRNGILLANEFDIQTGRYEFTDVELLFGNNDFELVFYGPQGQIERRNETYIVDQNALRANQNSFRFSAVDSNETLLGVTEIVEDPTLEGLNTGLVYERGITDWFTLGVGASFFDPREGEDVKSFSLRNNLSLGRFGLLNSVIQWDNEERRNYLANYRTRIGESNLTLNWNRNESEVEIGGTLQDNTSSSVGIVVSGTLFPGTRHTINHENSWSRNTSASSSATQRFRQSLSMVTGIGSFNHSFIGTKVEGTTIDNDWLVSGQLGYRNRYGRLFMRLFSTFEYRPQTELESLGASLNYPISSSLSSEFRYSYNVEQSTQSYDARLTWLGDNVSLSGFASYNDSENWSLNINARFSFGLNNENDATLITSRPISQAGALAVRVFEDLDLDKEYDEGEPLLDGVQVRAAQVSRKDTTEDGTAFLNRLPNNRRTDIVVDETTLPDYTYMRLDDGFSVTGRRGLLQFADIPFTRGGELDGTVYFVNSEGEEEPLTYVKLNLVNEKDEIVATTKSEFDGFYIFEKVIPGDYRLFIDERVLNQRNAIQEVTKKLNISNQGDLFTEVDLVLRELSQAKGYIAVVGEFRSLTLLKVYYGLLQKRVPPELLNDVFYMAPTLDFEYRIAIAFSEEELRAERSCEYAAQYQIECSVEYIEFGY